MKRQQLAVTAHQDERQESPVEICIASTMEEKLAIFRLRYHIYAEEMGKDFPCMDHGNKLLADELDHSAILIYAKTGSKLIGTLRINIGRIGDFPPFWTQVLSLRRFLEFDAQQLFAYASKFMVLQNYRNSTIPYLLTAKGYELYCQHKIQFSFGVCNFHLLRLYEQFGFRRYGRNFVDPGYGILAPYVLLVDDIRHLKAVHSPLYRIARKRGSLDDQAAKWFLKNFPENSGVINSHLIGEDALWDYLSTRYERAPNQIISILRGLSAAEAKLFLHRCGVVVRCRPEDQITFRGDICYELNVLIAGRLNSFRPRAAAVMPGQSFGAAGLVYHRKHAENIVAATEAEILVLADSAFFKFRHSHPAIAAQIVRALGRKTRITA